MGQEDPNIASPLNNLAELYREQGKYEQAQVLYQRALHIWQHTLGETHPYVAHPLDGLALLCTRQGKYEQAEPLYQRALAIRERQLGQHHPQTVAARTLAAQLAEARGTMRDGEAFPPSAEELPNQVRKEHLREEAFITPQETLGRSRIENDPLQEFLTTCCELHPRAWSRSTELWEAYTHWAEKYRDRYPLSRGAFIAQLKEHGCRTDRTKTARIWHGIALVKSSTMTEGDEG